MADQEAESDSDSAHGIEFFRVRSRDSWVAYQGDTIVASVSRGAGDEFWHAIVRGQRVDRDFTSAAYGREFVFGVVYGSRLAAS